MNDNLNPQQFLHGTTHPFQVGDLVNPTGRDGRAYFTHGEYDANAWARRRAGSTRQPPLVYPVEPTGEYHDDPYSTGGFRSSSPLRVTGPGRPARSTPEMREMRKTYRRPQPPHTDNYRGTEEAYRYADYD